MGCPSQRAPLGSNGIQVQVRLEGRRGGGSSSGGGRGESFAVAIALADVH